MWQAVKDRRAGVPQGIGGGGGGWWHSFNMSASSAATSQADVCRQKEHFEREMMMKDEDEGSELQTSRSDADGITNSCSYPPTWLHLPAMCPRSQLL